MVYMAATDVPQENSTSARLAHAMAFIPTNQPPSAPGAAERKISNRSDNSSDGTDKDAPLGVKTVFGEDIRRLRLAHTGFQLLLESVAGAYDIPVMTSTIVLKCEC